jgi:hypothetical protein
MARDAAVPASAGGATRGPGAGGTGTSPSLSFAGRYLAYQGPGTAVHMLDRSTGGIADAGDAGIASSPVVLADGSAVLFSRAAGVLESEVVRWTAASGATERVATGSLEDATPTGSAVLVATSSPLVAGDTNGGRDLYVLDIAAGRYERTTLTTDGRQAPALPSAHGVLSGDGRTVAWSGPAAALVHTVDRSGPAPVAAPAVGFAPGATMGRTSIPVTLSWGAGAEPVCAWNLQRATGTGDFADVAVDPVTATSSGRNPVFGTSYRYRVRGADCEGDLDGFSASAQVLVNLREEANAALRYTGAWSQGTLADYSGGHTRYTTQPGAAVTYAFTGRGIAWIAPRGTLKGQAEVLVDGVSQGTIDLRLDAPGYRRIVFAKTFAAAGGHTLTIRALGAPASRPRIDVDALVVLR